MRRTKCFEVTSHHTPSQAYTWPSPTVAKRCRLRFTYTLTLRKFILSSLFHSPSRFSFEKSCSLFLKPISSPQGGYFYLVTAFNLPHYSNAFNLLITALGLFTFLVVMIVNASIFSLRRSFLQNACASLSEYCIRLFAFFVLDFLYDGLQNHVPLGS